MLTWKWYQFCIFADVFLFITDLPKLFSANTVLLWQKFPQLPPQRQGLKLAFSVKHFYLYMFEIYWTLAIRSFVRRGGTLVILVSVGVVDVSSKMNVSIEENKSPYSIIFFLITRQFNRSPNWSLRRDYDLDDIKEYSTFSLDCFLLLVKALLASYIKLSNCSIFISLMIVWNLYV